MPGSLKKSVGSPEWCSLALGQSEPLPRDLSAMGWRAFLELSPASWRETIQPMDPARFESEGLL